MRLSVYPLLTKFELMNIVVVVILLHLINSMYTELRRLQFTHLRITICTDELFLFSGICALLQLAVDRVMDSIHPTRCPGLVWMSRHVTPFLYIYTVYTDQSKFLPFKVHEMHIWSAVDLFNLYDSFYSPSLGKTSVEWCTFSRFLNGSYEITSASLQMNYVNMESYFSMNREKSSLHTPRPTMTIPLLRIYSYVGV